MVALRLGRVDQIVCMQSNTIYDLVAKAKSGAAVRNHVSYTSTPRQEVSRSVNEFRESGLEVPCRSVVEKGALTRMLQE